MEHPTQRRRLPGLHLNPVPDPAAEMSFVFLMSWKFDPPSSMNQLGSPRAQVLRISNPIQGKEVEVPAVYSNSWASDPASASEAASVDMPGAVTAGQFVAGYAGASGVAFVDVSEMAYAGILAATGGH